MALRGKLPKSGVGQDQKDATFPGFSVWVYLFGGPPPKNDKDKSNMTIILVLLLVCL